MRAEYVAMAGSAAAVFAGLIFGLSGVLTVLAMTLLFLPALLILQNFALDSAERLFFAVFISLGLFPLAVWLVNKLVPSFRVSVFVAAALGLTGLAWLLWRRK